MSETNKDQGDLRGRQIHSGKIAEWIQMPMRELIATLLTCLMNPRIYFISSSGVGTKITGPDAIVKMGPNGWTAQLDLSSVGGGSGGGSLELTDGTTDLTSVTKITVNGMTVGGTSSAATLLVNPWIKVLTLKSSGRRDNGDSYNTNQGIVVAKMYKNRAISGPSSESIRGSTYNYSYAYDGTNDEYIRTTTGGASTSDFQTPPALAGQEIIAAYAPGIISGVDWVEISERKWASA